MRKRIISVGLVCVMLAFAAWGGNQNYTKAGRQTTLTKYDVEYVGKLTKATT